MRDPSSEAAILLVNYDQSNHGLGLILWSEGYDVALACTIDAAKSELARRSFDLLIARYMMPYGSGGELIELAWERYRLPGLLMVGATKPQEAKARVRPDAWRGVLGIPLSIERVLEAIEGVLPASKIPTFADSSKISARCPDCCGRGEILLLTKRVPCERCGGSGQVRRDVLDVPLRECTIPGSRTRFALHRAGIRTLRQAAELTDDQLHALPDITPSQVDSIKAAIGRFRPAGQ